MASFADLNPVIESLLGKGGISAMRSRNLFDTVLTHERRLQGWLDGLAMELVVDRTAGFAIARNRRPEDLEAMAEDAEVARLEPVFTRQPLKHWQSVVLVVLKLTYDREKRSQGREEWLAEDDLVDQAKVFFPPEHLEDEAGVVKHIKQILETFAGANRAPLVMKRSQSGRTFWRGTPWLDMAVTIDEVRDYQRRMLAVAVESIEHRGEEVPAALRDALAGLASWSDK